MPRIALLALTLAATGCAAFTNPPPASFRKPAEQMAVALRKVAVAPTSRVAVGADALHDLRVIGKRALLDFRGESGGPSDFAAFPTCGPLELRDIDTNERVWSIERPGACGDEILATFPRLSLVGTREVKGSDERKKELTLSLIALDSGKVTASVALETGALALPVGDAFVVIEGPKGKQRVSLLEGEALKRAWTLALEDAGQATKVVAQGGSLLVVGSGVTAIDKASGKRLGGSAFGPGSIALDATPAADATFATILRENKDISIVKIGPDGRVIWTRNGAGRLDTVGASLVYAVNGKEVSALGAADGTPVWTGTLPGVGTGPGLLVQQGKGSLWVIPNDHGVTAFDAISGALRFSVSPFGAGDGEASAADRLSLAGPGLVVLDTARGIAGLDLANEGRARYVIPVRSLPYVHRQARLHAAYGSGDLAAMLASTRAGVKSRVAMHDAFMTLSNSTGGGMSIAGAQMSMAATTALLTAGANNFSFMLSAMEMRRGEQAKIALRQAEIDDESAFVLRPVAWPMGRALLVVRKSDGAFREIVTGPPDFYEDPYRPASIAALVPSAQRVLTFAEGVDPSTWGPSIVRTPVELVPRSLLAYALDEPSFLPASEYAQRSLVPAAGQDAKAARAPANEGSPPPPAASPAPPPVTPPASAAPPAVKPRPVASTPPPAPPPPRPSSSAPPPPIAAPAPSAAPNACRSHLDCKAGMVCPKGQCVAPSCVGDRECGAGRFCSLEGVCEPVKR